VFRVSCLFRLFRGFCGALCCIHCAFVNRWGAKAMVVRGFVGGWAVCLVALGPVFCEYVGLAGAGGEVCVDVLGFALLLEFFLIIVGICAEYLTLSWTLAMTSDACGVCVSGSS
jgi:uncharacterized membrane protein